MNYFHWRKLKKIEQEQKLFCIGTIEEWLCEEDEWNCVEKLNSFFIANSVKAKNMLFFIIIIVVVVIVVICKLSKSYYQ